MLSSAAQVTANASSMNMGMIGRNFTVEPGLPGARATESPQ